MRPVKCFVVGCSRSGTTLLSVLLDRSSQLAIPPETVFYPEIASRMDGEIPLPDILAGWSRLPELGLDIETVMRGCGANPSPGRVLATILDLYAGLRGKEYSGEKSPWHCDFVDRILDDFPDARIIFSLRDGRDTALSLVSMPWWNHDLRQAASDWLRTARGAIANFEKHPDRFMVVRHEDLLAAPADTLRGVMQRLDLPFEERQLSSQVPSGVVLPRSMQWKGRALKDIDQARVGHWRTTATADEAAWLNQEMGDLLRHFGYDA